MIVPRTTFEIKLWDFIRCAKKRLSNIVLDMPNKTVGFNNNE